MSDTATATVAPAKVPAPKQLRLKEARMQRIEHMHTVWSIYSEHGVAFDDLLKREYWAHVARAKNMQRGDQIHVYPDDGAFYALLMVRDVGDGWVDVTPIITKTFDDAVGEGDAPASSGYDVKWQGNVNKFVVVRKSDNDVLSTGHKDKVSAHAWLAEYGKALRA